MVDFVFSVNFGTLNWPKHLVQGLYSSQEVKLREISVNYMNLFLSLYKMNMFNLFPNKP